MLREPQYERVGRWRGYEKPTEAKVCGECGYPLRSCPTCPTCQGGEHLEPTDG